MKNLIRRATQFIIGSQTDGYSSQIINRVIRDIRSPPLTATFESAVALWGRAMASATITGSQAITPSVMEGIGRRLATAGEYVALIRVESDGSIQLLPASDYEVYTDSYGRPDYYHITLPGNIQSKIIRVDAPGVIHIKINPQPNTPWRGNSPLAGAGQTTTLLQAIEGAISGRYSEGIGSVLVTPSLTPEQKNTLINSIQGGGITTAVGENSIDSLDRWRAIHLAPEGGNYELALEHARSTILQSYGILSALHKDATGIREALRFLVFNHLTGIARIAEQELSSKLETEVSIQFIALQAGDISGKARALSSIANAYSMAGASPAEILAAIREAEVRVNWR